MKKKTLHRFALILLVCMFCTMLTVGASANNYGGDYYCTEGDMIIEKYPVLQQEEKTVSLELFAGTMPPGLTVSQAYFPSEQQTYLMLI